MVKILPFKKPKRYKLFWRSKNAYEKFLIAENEARKGRDKFPSLWNMFKDVFFTKKDKDV